MSEFGEIEAEVVAVLAALELDEAPLFAEVRAGASGDARGRMAALARLRTPAVVVTVDGRLRGTFDDAALGSVRVYVTIAERNLRGRDGARLGDVDTAGAFVAAERVTAALAGLVIGDRRLVGRDERVVNADARQVVIEQAWIAEEVF